MQISSWNIFNILAISFSKIKLKCQLYKFYQFKNAFKLTVKMATSVRRLLCLTLNCHFYCACVCFKKGLNYTFYSFEYVFYICNNQINKFLFVFHHNKHNIIIWAFIKCQYAFERQCFCHCVHISFKSHISITTCLNFLIFCNRH